MEELNDLIAKLRAVAESQARFKLEAYSFIMGALNHALTKLEKPRHLSGQEFCGGIREFTISQYGPLSLLVLEHWGITRTRDFGEIVFALVDAGLMSKTAQDSIMDFNEVYDFKEAFSRPSEFNLDDLNLDWHPDKKDTGGYG